MEDKNELSDIVLDKDDGKILKTKRILIIVAILIILFLAVILSMKLFNSSTNNKTANLVLPPEPISSIQKTKQGEELFKQVPIIEENKTKKDNFDNIVRNLKAKEAKIAQTQTEVQETSKAQTKTSVQPVVKPIIKPKTDTAQKAVKKEPKSRAKAIVNKGIYIQVGATSKHNPNKNFLKKIADQKLKYKLLPITIKGKKVMKILVGPFKTRSVAKQNLPKVKKYLNKNAFIYSVR